MLQQTELSISKSVLDFLVRHLENYPKYSTLFKRSTDSEVIALLKQWSQGISKPTSTMVRWMSGVTAIPETVFFLDTPSILELNSTLLKSKVVQDASKFSPEVERLIVSCALLQRQELQSISSVLQIKTHLRPQLTYDSSFHSALNTINRLLGVRALALNTSTNLEASFFELCRYVSNAGVVVVAADKDYTQVNLNPLKEPIRAFALMDSVPLIFINNTDEYSNQIFALIFCFIQLCFGKSVVLNTYFTHPTTLDPKRLRLIDLTCRDLTLEVLSES